MPPRRHVAAHVVLERGVVRQQRRERRAGRQHVPDQRPAQRRRTVERERWTQHWMREGFAAFESLLADNPSTGLFCEGDEPTLADICLVPQVYNAVRWSVDMSPFPIIRRINDSCMRLEEFERAKPENQPDAPKS